MTDHSTSNITHVEPSRKTVAEGLYSPRKHYHMRVTRRALVRKKAERTTLSERFALLRHSLKLRVSDLALTLGVSQSYLSQIELGKAVPADALLNRLAEVCGVEPDWLQTGRPPMFRKDLLEAIEARAAALSLEHPLRPSRFKDLLRQIRTSGELSPEVLREFALELGTVLGVDDPEGSLLGVYGDLPWHAVYPLSTHSRMLLMLRERLGRLTRLEEILREWSHVQRVPDHANEWEMLVSIWTDLLLEENPEELDFAARAFEAMARRLRTRAAQFRGAGRTGEISISAQLDRFLEELEVSRTAR